jgi:CBS domain-containing membrane protein
MVGGHIISALIGITAYKLLPSEVALASALAVSLSIAAMHLTKTIHPPGGATALIAVIGSNQIHDLGYLYVLSPVGSGVLIMLIVALGVNNLSGDPDRHYPKRWL